VENTVSCIKTVLFRASIRSGSRPSKCLIKPPHEPIQEIPVIAPLVIETATLHSHTGYRYAAWLARRREDDILALRNQASLMNEPVLVA
jgi:hypothetical protein